jgi:hypothetical protein
MRGRNDRPVVRDEVQEVETLQSREGRGFVDERCVVSAARDLVRGAEDRVCRRQAIESLLDVFLLGGELSPELQHQRIGPLPIERFERLARTRRDAPRDQRHGDGDDASDQQEEPRPQSHGAPLLSQTSAKFQLPDALTAGRFQVATRSLNP